MKARVTKHQRVYLKKVLEHMDNRNIGSIFITIGSREFEITEWHINTVLDEGTYSSRQKIWLNSLREMFNQ